MTGIHCKRSRGKRSRGKRSRVIAAARLLAIILFGVLIRIRGLELRSFWFDEAFSWRMTQFPLGELFEHVARDNHPPLYFVLLKIWSGIFGESVAALRGISILLAAVTMLSMYLFMTEAYKSVIDEENSDFPLSRSQTLGLFTVGLVAVSVFQIRWAWEVRMYMLGTALVAFSSWALFRALHAEQRAVRYWLIYAISALLSAYTHYYCIFTIASQFIFVAGYLLMHSEPGQVNVLKDPRLRYIALALTVIVLGFLPQLPVLLQQRAQVQSNFWTTDVGRWDIPYAVYQMFVEPEDATFTRVGSVICSALVILVLVSLLWRARAPDVYLVVVALGPLDICLLITQFDTKIFHLRYFLFTQLFLLAAIARAVWRLPSPIKNVTAAVVVLNSLVIYASFWTKMDFAHRPGARAAAMYLAKERRPDEQVVSCSGLYFLSNLYHANDRSGYYCFHNGEGVVHYEGGAVLLPEDLITEKEIAATKANRIWLVNMQGGDWGNRTVPVPKSWRLTQTETFREAYGVQGNMIVEAYETNVASVPPENPLASKEIAAPAP